MLRILLLLLLASAWSVKTVRAEFMAHWYVIHDTKEDTYSDYFTGIAPETMRGILAPHQEFETIFWCDIMGNTSGILDKHVEQLVRVQFRKETFRVLSKYDPKGNPYVKMTQYDTLVNYCSEFYHLNHNYLKAFILRNSGVNEKMTGAAGEIGLMQIPPDAVRRIINEKGLSGFPLERTYEPAWNIAFGAYILQGMTEEFDKDVDKIITAWKRGTDNVKRNPELVEEEREYVDRIKYLACIFDSFPQPGDPARSVIK